MIAADEGEDLFFFYVAFSYLCSLMLLSFFLKDPERKIGVRYYP